MVCGTVGAVDHAFLAIARTKPDLVLADIDLRGIRGLELIKKLRSVNPLVKLLAISTHNQAHHAARVLRLGGDGYIMKHEDPDEIVCAVHDVLAGLLYVSEEVIESPQAGGRSRSFRRDHGPPRSSRSLSLTSWTGWPQPGQMR